MATFELRLQASGDDVEETVSTGSVAETGLTLDIGREHIALWFDNVTIDQGSTISAAYIEFVANATDSAALTLDVFFQDSDDAPALSTSDFDVSGRTARTTVTEWTPAAWTNGFPYQTADLAAALQEVVDRPGWASGNAICVIIDGDGGSLRRRAKSFDTDSGAAALLHVDYVSSTIFEASGSMRMGMRMGGAAIHEASYYPAGAMRTGVRMGGAGVLSTDFYPAGGLRSAVRLGGTPYTYAEYFAAGGIRSDVRLGGTAVMSTAITDASRNAEPARLVGSHNEIVLLAPARLAGAKLNNGL
ncbi:MAG: hypothetical protein H6641_15665 [Caldilineaceae bacterium]|nr:hypothetical protein [Caldilineaceae bacterium]